ncbi:MAG: GGDEF domain-containing protein [Gammaproteobacteria bacterium]
MRKSTFYKFNREPDILNGFNRTLAEIEWLLLALVLFYLAVSNNGANKATLIVASCLFAAASASFQYVNFFNEAKQWKIAVQTWGMIFFISWVIWYTGKLDSPLFNLYLLPIIVSSIALGKLATLLEVALICVCFIFLLHNAGVSEQWLSLEGGSELAVIFFPMLLVAYIATMLSADIQAGFNRLKIISETDDLTKLFNLRTFNSLAAKQFKQAERHIRQLAILMLDIDNLKQVNDTLGHEAGNILLQNVAQCFVAILRGEDIAARYGGDEFVILLTDCDGDNAVLVADRIMEEFKSIRIRYRGSNVALSASIGIACFPEQGRTAEDLLDKADKAMYYSKQGGKSRATMYREEAEMAAL